MHRRVDLVCELLIFVWEGLFGHPSPREVLTAVMMFNCLIGYSLCRTATRRQLTTLCAFESVVLLVWVLGMVVLRVTGTS